MTTNPNPQTTSLRPNPKAIGETTTDFHLSHHRLSSLPPPLDATSTHCPYFHHFQHPKKKEKSPYTQITTYNPTQKHAIQPNNWWKEKSHKIRKEKKKKTIEISNLL